MSRHTALASIILLATASMAARAGEPQRQAEASSRPSVPEATAPDSAATLRSGLKAYIDPKTGKPGPVPAPTRRTEIVTPESPFGLRNNALMWTETLKDGTIMLHTEGQVQMATFARFGEDGKATLYCDPVALKPEHAKQRPASNQQEAPK